jgi:hypothetical protein
MGAAERGVHVRVLCGGKHGISDWDILDTFSSLRVLKRFGVKARRWSPKEVAVAGSIARTSRSWA